ncbi:SHOCT domain-containing protein [Streptomyces sp. R39]|uniref:SHOCT domain-containing protein n=1 Tax=Streptomyces sp. R39 TaxID=3238631 RepID=A0AB39QH61_9ACTN
MRTAPAGAGPTGPARGRPGPAVRPPPARTTAPNPSHGRPPGGRRRILAERYARGEIDEEEYRRRLDTLRGSRSGPAGN